MYFIGPLALVLIFMILFALYGNFKFPVTIALGVIMTEPVGALVALKLTHTPFSVSSVLGLLALLGVSVETAVILVSYINKLRQEGMDIRDGHPRGVAAATSSDHDDGAGGVPGAASGRAVDRHRVGHAEALRHRHRGRADLPALHRLLREPGAVRNGRARRRRPAGLGKTRPLVPGFFCGLCEDFFAFFAVKSFGLAAKSQNLNRKGRKGFAKKRGEFWRRLARASRPRPDQRASQLLLWLPHITFVPYAWHQWFIAPLVQDC